MGERKHRALNVYDEQLAAFENAAIAARRRLGDDATVGDVVEELSVAYTGDYEHDAEATASKSHRRPRPSGTTNRTTTTEPLVIEAGPTEIEGEITREEDPTRPPFLVRLTERLGGLVP